MARRLRYVLLLLVGLLALAELGARVGWSEAGLSPGELGFLFVDHPTLFWHKRPDATLNFGGVEVRTNAWGMRSPPLAAVKAAGVHRVLLLGESTTEGASMTEAQTYARQLADRLGPSFEVINAGTGGWTIWQSMVMLEEWGPALAPDVVIPYHQANDFLPSGVMDPGNYLYAVGTSDRTLYERRARVRPLLEGLLRSYAWRLLRQAVLFSAPPLPRLTPGPHPEFPPRVPREDRLLAWARIARWCEGHGADLVVVRPISGVYLPEDDVLPTVATTYGAPYLDLPAWLLARGIRPERLLFDPVHPTVEGHTRIAEAMSGVVPPSRE